MEKKAWALLGWYMSLSLGGTQKTSPVIQEIAQMMKISEKEARALRTKSLRECKKHREKLGFFKAPTQ